METDVFHFGSSSVECRWCLARTTLASQVKEVAEETLSLACRAALATGRSLTGGGSDKRVASEEAEPPKVIGGGGRNLLKHLEVVARDSNTGHPCPVLEPRRR